MQTRYRHKPRTVQDYQKPPAFLDRKEFVRSCMLERMYDPHSRILLARKIRAPGAVRRPQEHTCQLARMYLAHESRQVSRVRPLYH